MDVPGEDFDLLDPPFVRGEDFQLELVVGEAPPLARDRPGAVVDVAADGLIFGISRNPDAELFLDVEDRHLGVDDPSPAGDLPEGVLFADVVFVFDLADELFEDVLDRDDPFRPSVFVDDDRHVDLLIAELLEKVGDLFVFRGVEDWLCDRFEGGVEILARGGVIFQDVFVEDDSDDLVEGVAVDRNPAVPFRGKEAGRLADSGVGGEAEEVDSGDHDLFGDPLFEIDEGAD